MGAHKIKRYSFPIPDEDQLGINKPIINSKIPNAPKILLPVFAKIFGSISLSLSNTKFFLTYILL